MKVCVVLMKDYSRDTVEVVGVFSKRKKALEAIHKIREIDKDISHEYYIRGKFEVNPFFVWG